jgi:hypothetical protein
MARPAAYINNRPPGKLDMPRQLIGGILGQACVEHRWLCLLKAEEPEQANRPGQTLPGWFAAPRGPHQPSRGALGDVRVRHGLPARL